MCINKRINREVKKDLFGIESDDDAEIIQKYKKSNNRGRSIINIIDGTESN